MSCQKEQFQLRKADVEEISDSDNIHCSPARTVADISAHIQAQYPLEIHKGNPKSIENPLLQLYWSVLRRIANNIYTQAIVQIFCFWGNKHSPQSVS